MRRTRRRCGPIVLLAILCMLLGETGCQAHQATEEEASPPGSAGPPHGAPGIAGTAEDAGGEVVATVAGVAITRKQLVDELMTSDGAQTLREMMLRIAVAKEADAKGIAVTDGEVDRELRRMSENYGGEAAYYEAMQEQLGMNRDELRRDAKYRLQLERLATQNVQVSDQEIDAYLSGHQADFGPQTQFKLSHIVLPDERQAKDVLARLESGEDFAKLALTYSTDEYTADSGGDLGWIDADDPFTDPALLNAAGGLDVGQAAGPIRTKSGYELVQLNGRIEKPGLDAQAAREEARRQVAFSKAAPMAELEQSLLDKYKAQIFDAALQP